MLPVLAYACLGVVAASPVPVAPLAKHQRELPNVQPTPSDLDAFAEDLHSLLPETTVSTQKIDSDGVPHAVFILTPTKTEGVASGNPLQVAEDLARNRGLYLEYQVGIGDEPRIGIIVSSPFPTLTLCWEAHPQEDVPTANGMWRTPFADMGDVAEILGEGQGVSLRLHEGSVRRIDHAALAHGHRRYRILLRRNSEIDTFGPYTWMAGLGRIAGPPVTDTDPTALLEGLAQQFKARIAARDYIARTLELGSDVSWTAPPVRPAYRAVFSLWALPGDGWSGEAPFYAPLFGTPPSSPQWIALREGASGDVSMPMPPSWRIEGAVVLADGEASLVLSGDPTEQAIDTFLRRHMDGHVAVMMGGDVIAVVSAEEARSGRLVLGAFTHEENAAIMGRWERLLGDARLDVARATGGAPTTDAAPPTPNTLKGDLDFFQVRLMAEPQDRKLIPVTHFTAPGSAQGVLVAVQNDVILDSHAVTGARLETRSDRLYLHLSLTEAGRDALSDACFTNLGKQLAIVYEDKLLCAPTIVDWEQEELTFKGMSDDWPDVAVVMAARFGES